MKQRLFRSSRIMPVGEITAIASEAGLCFLEFNREKRSTMLTRRLNAYFGNYRLTDGPHEYTDLAWQWLDIYFNDRRQPDLRVPMDVRGTTFEKQVWGELQKIPFGKTAGYGDIAANIGNPAGSRAVGGACGRNPVSIIVPCHRVVGSAGALTGYGGGLDTKLFLLKLESTAL